MGAVWSAVKRAVLSAVHGSWSAIRRAGRGYWSAVVLAIPAAGLLAGGTAVSGTAAAAMVGAGAALAGAVGTRVVGLAEQAKAGRQRDLDETRRVAYMALLANRAQAPELVATIVNALAHHGLGADPGEAASHLINLVGMSINRPESERWLQEQIDEINRKLGQ
jgi:hypothetical protein